MFRPRRCPCRRNARVEFCVASASHECSPFQEKGQKRGTYRLSPASSEEAFRGPWPEIGSALAEPRRDHPRCTSISRLLGRPARGHLSVHWMPRKETGASQRLPLRPPRRTDRRGGSAGRGRRLSPARRRSARAAGRGMRTESRGRRPSPATKHWRREENVLAETY